MRTAKSMTGASMGYGKPRALSGNDKNQAPQGGKVSVQKGSSITKK